VFIKHKHKTSTQNTQNQQIIVKCEAMLGKAVVWCLSQGICYHPLLEIGVYMTLTFQLNQLIMVLIFLEISDGS